MKKVPQQLTRGKEEKDEEEPKSLAPAGGDLGMHLDSRIARSVRCVRDQVFV
jgi:hypothetical protein